MSKLLLRKKLEGRRKKVKKTVTKKKNDKSIKEKGFYTIEGDSKYKQGKFFSRKNKKEVVFRSSYEFAYFHVLEEDNNVVSYIVEPFSIDYYNSGIKKKYWPDLLVLYKDSSLKLIEIKPAAKLKFKSVRLKASAARKHCRENMENCTYHFVTEEDIFRSKEDYRKLLKYVDA